MRERVGLSIAREPSAKPYATPGSRIESLPRTSGRDIGEFVIKSGRIG